MLVETSLANRAPKKGVKSIRYRPTRPRLASTIASLEAALSLSTINPLTSRQVGGDMKRFALSSWNVTFQSGPISAAGWMGSDGGCREHAIATRRRIRERWDRRLSWH